MKNIFQFSIIIFFIKCHSTHTMASVMVMASVCFFSLSLSILFVSSLNVSIRNHNMISSFESFYLQGPFLHLLFFLFFVSNLFIYFYFSFRTLVHIFFFFSFYFVNSKLLRNNDNATLVDVCVCLCHDTLSYRISHVVK